MRTLFWISAIAAGLLIMSGCAAPTPLPPTAAPTGSLEGLVSDASTGSPIRGAQVTIAGQGGVFTLVTGADGKLKITVLPAGIYLVSAQATGYNVNAVQVGVVSNVTSIGNVSLEPAVTDVVPDSTPTPTASPTSPAPTPIIITVVASPVPTQTPVSTRRASAGAMPMTVRAAPVLLEPRDGSVFVGPRLITFRWEGSCCLAADEYYVVSLPHPQGVEEAWVKTTTWESPDYLYLLVPPSRKLTWNVSVRRHTGEYSNGQWKGPIVSRISETWYLMWHREGGDKPGKGSPLPTPPVSPLPAPGQ